VSVIANALFNRIVEAIKDRQAAGEEAED